MEVTVNQASEFVNSLAQLMNSLPSKQFKEALESSKRSVNWLKSLKEIRTMDEGIDLGGKAITSLHECKGLVSKKLLGMEKLQTLCGPIRITAASDLPVAANHLDQLRQKLSERIGIDYSHLISEVDFWTTFGDQLDSTLASLIESFEDLKERRSNLINSNSLRRRRIAKFTFAGTVIIIILLLIMSRANNQNSQSNMRAEATPTTTNIRLTLANYQNLHSGVSQAGVAEVLGEGRKISSTDSTVTYRWTSDKAAIRITFKDGVIWKRSEKGLK